MTSPITTRCSNSFPAGFHEPYYASYLREDLDRLMDPGFTPAGQYPAYFSKVVSYRREPDRAAGPAPPG